MESEPESKTSLLKFEPQSIDFGSLSPGKGASVMLNVHGGPGRVSVRSDQLKASLATFEYGDSILEIMLLAGVPGELIWDEVILQTDTQDFRVSVTARWEQFPALETTASEPATEATAVEVNEIPTLSGTQNLASTRRWVGRRCPRCHKNLVYDSNIHDWEQCRCDYSPHTKEGLSNLHIKGKYANDTSTYITTIVLIIIALCIAIVPWYPFVVSHNKLWLILSIPLSIIGLPPAIIWICGLKKH